MHTRTVRTVVLAVSFAIVPIAVGSAEDLSGDKLYSSVKEHQQEQLQRIEDAKRELEYYKSLESLVEKAASSPEKYSKELIKSFQAATAQSRFGKAELEDLFAFITKYDPAMKKMLQGTPISVQVAFTGKAADNHVVPIFRDSLLAKLQAGGFTINDKNAGLSIRQTIQVTSQSQALKVFNPNMNSIRVGGHLSFTMAAGTVLGSWNNSEAGVHIDPKTAAGTAAQRIADKAARYIIRTILEKYAAGQLP